jgi:integration host factor subunit beta
MDNFPKMVGWPMIKSQLVRRIAAKTPHLSQRNIEKIVNIILTTIVDAMARGDRVEAAGFWNVLC